MATRPPRLKRPNTFFHVTSRGTNKWNIFLDHIDRQCFLALLAAVHKRCGIEVHAYCLMGNHFHLVVFCPDPVLSAAMRDLKSRYAKYYNKRHKGTGAVFEAPFVEVPVLDDEHLKKEIRYVHRNPLDLDPHACLADFPWSSHGVYLGLRPQPRFMRTRIVRGLFGPNYRLDVEAPRPSDKVQKSIRRSVTSPGEVTHGVVDDWSLASILREVAHAANVELGKVAPGERNGLIGVAVLMASDYAGFTTEEIMNPFGYRSASAVRMAAKRARAALENQPRLQRIYDDVLTRFNTAA